MLQAFFFTYVTNFKNCYWATESRWYQSVYKHMEVPAIPVCRVLTLHCLSTGETEQNLLLGHNDTKSWNDMKSFTTSLKRFLYHHSFYSIEEYYEYNDDKGM